jgi:hypothetical protein
LKAKNDAEARSNLLSEFEDGVLYGRMVLILLGIALEKWVDRLVFTTRDCPE